MSRSEVDRETIETLKMILEDRFDLLINTYITDCEGRRERLRKAIGNGDFNAIRHEAHGLKGSSRNIGANCFADICERVEHRACKEDDTGLEQDFAVIETKLAAVVDELATYLH